MKQKLGALLLKLKAIRDSPLYFNLGTVRKKRVKHGNENSIIVLATFYEIIFAQIHEVNRDFY